jgi:hypothetical protein
MERHPFHQNIGCITLMERKGKLELANINLKKMITFNGEWSPIIHDTTINLKRYQNYLL